MNQAEIEAWIAAQGGPGNVQYSITTKRVPNPNAYDPESNPTGNPLAPEYINARVETWTNKKTGAQLSGTRQSDGTYDITTNTGADPNRTTPRGQPPKEKDEGGRRYVWNEDTNQWEDVGPAPPNPQERADQQAKEAEDRRRQQEQETEARRKATTIKEQHTDADGTEWTQYEDGHWVSRGPSLAEQRQAAQFNRPQIISAPPGQRRIAQQDNEGNITSVDNPNFDQAAYDRQAAKEKAQAERDRLSLMIEAGKLTEATAAAQYKRWFDENVTIPLQRSQEARARAEELRLAQEAEDRRQQFAANYEKDRQTTAIHAGEAAANAFNSNLQYQVGPAFGEQFAKALDSFQPGAAPAHFTADAFTFKGPSIEAVARKATANALAGISPYAQAIATAGNRPLQVASYGPGTDVAAGAPPPAAAPPDYAGLINQYLQNNPYVPGGGGDTEEDQ